MSEANWAKRFLGAILGHRLPITEGAIRVEGLAEPVTVRRDRFGIPYIEAKTDADAWYGLGFCQGQDRSFQLETLTRVCRGTLSELVGAKALPIDRFSRRVGFLRQARKTLAVQTPETLAVFEAFARGVNDGRKHGCRKPAHEFTLLRCEPTPWSALEVAAMTKLVSYFLCNNWDAELARLRILVEDGAAALIDLEPEYLAHHPVSAPPGRPAGPALGRLEADAALLQERLGLGGGSNNWALGAERTRTRRPILANDPHLDPAVPGQFYLARIQTPEWRVAGAAFVGTPGVAAGHNGFMAWGVTSGMADQTDLFLEEIGADGASVREGDAFTACELVEETIRVRGEDPVLERVLLTPRGPIVSPAIGEETYAISFSAAWLAPEPIEGFMAACRCTDFEGFRRCFARWTGPSINIAYADASGTVGWQFAGRVPRRRGSGLVPQWGAEPGAGWEPEPVPFEQMPHSKGSGLDVIVTANNRPIPEGTDAPYLGAEWTQGYRAARLYEALGERTDWDIDSTLQLQTNVDCLPWREAREAVLAVPPLGEEARQALELLRAWDGRVAADSSGAAVWELFVHEIALRTTKLKAPRAWAWAMGKGRSRLNPFNKFAVRRITQIVTLLREQPGGWFAGGWPAEISDALASVVRLLRKRRGRRSSDWAWGRLRPVTLRHPAGDRWPLDAIFNLGPFAWGGDTATVGMATSHPLEPLDNPVTVATMRMAIDVGGWDHSRWILAGGQSGNPFSPHYRDQFMLWKEGDGIPISWTIPPTEEANMKRLDLVPAPARRQP